MQFQICGSLKIQFITSLPPPPTDEHKYTDSKKTTFDILFVFETGSHVFQDDLKPHKSAG